MPRSGSPLETPGRKLSADRWEALTGTVRIRPLGSAGFELMPGVVDNGYRHMGFELWSRYDYDKTIDNSFGVKRLEQYADTVRAFNLITHGQQPASLLTDPKVIAKVPLSARQERQIVQLCVHKQLAMGHPEAESRVLSALVKKGFASKVDSADWQGQDTWAITEAGRIRCTFIYDR